MIVACQEVIMLFTIQRIHFVSTSLFTFKAVREMVCKDKNVKKLQIQLKTKDAVLLKYYTGMAG
jgi:hypothetical protein